MTLSDPLNSFDAFEGTSISKPSSNTTRRRIVQDPYKDSAGPQLSLRFFRNHNFTEDNQRERYFQTVVQRKPANQVV